MLSRRSLLAGSVCALGAPFINRGRFRLSAAGPEYSTKAIDLVRRSNVIDMLGLLTLDYPKLVSWQTAPDRFRESEFLRLRASGVTVLHPAVGFTEGDTYSPSLRDLIRWNNFIAAHSSRFLRVLQPADLDECKATGKIGVVLGLQNSDHFRTLEDVDYFYAIGQRVSQLTYYNNALGGGSTDPRRGLTVFGASVVARMNRLGMAIDVSHCSDRTTLDAIELSSRPVLVTHSNCRELVPSSPRCKSDEAIRKLAANGGVLGITLVRLFVRPNGAANIEHVLDHVDHAVRIAGIEHVGLGTDVDLDGRDGPSPKRNDLDGISYAHKVFDLTEGLLRRNYGEAAIDNILGANFRRVLGQIWTV